jgi:hypothetical protein
MIIDRAKCNTFQMFRNNKESFGKCLPLRYVAQIIEYYQEGATSEKELLQVRLLLLKKILPAHFGQDSSNA